jgi:microcystin-dependent protein
MPITSPDFLPMPFASQGQRIEIPATGAGNGRASWAIGFPPETALPRQAGGVPPHRLDFQGVLNALSQHTFFQQSGSIYPWNANLDYMVGAHVVGTDGVEYVAVQASGANENTGARNPVNDALRQYWQPLKLNLVDLIYPVGSIVELANSTNPNTIWTVTTWQQLEAGRMTIAAGGAYPLGSRGGNAQVTLTVNQMPAHTHTASTNTAGTHTHTRGSMNITGQFNNEGQWGGVTGPGVANGAFYMTRSNNSHLVSPVGGVNSTYNFDASRSWTGATSQNGSHTHTVTVGNTGGGQAVNILNPYLAVNKWQRIA